jgi:hypothetical protein
MSASHIRSEALKSLPDNARYWLGFVIFSPFSPNSYGDDISALPVPSARYIGQKPILPLDIV